MLEWESFSLNDEWYYYTFLKTVGSSDIQSPLPTRKTVFFKKNKLRIVLKTLSAIDDSLSVNPEQ